MSGGSKEDHCPLNDINDINDSKCRVNANDAQNVAIEKPTGLSKWIYVYGPDARSEQKRIYFDYYLDEQLINIVIEYNNNEYKNNPRKLTMNNMYGTRNVLLVTPDINGKLKFTNNVSFESLGDTVYLYVS